MSNVTIAYLENNLTEGTEAMKKLISRMIEQGATKLILTDHPDYDLELGIAGTDLGYDNRGVDLFPDHSVPMINKHRKKFEAWLQENNSDDEVWIDEEIKWPWIQKCWELAGGINSNCKVALLDNGIGDMIDLDTGDEPEESLGFDDIG